jgi:hypothetical protein
VEQQRKEREEVERVRVEEERLEIDTYRKVLFFFLLGFFVNFSGRKLKAFKDPL